MQPFLALSIVPQRCGKKKITKSKFSEQSCFAGYVAAVIYVSRWFVEKFRMVDWFYRVILPSPNGFWILSEFQVVPCRLLLSIAAREAREH